MLLPPSPSPLTSRPGVSPGQGLGGKGDTKRGLPLWLMLALLTASCMPCGASHVYLHRLETQPPLNEDSWDSLAGQEGVRPSPSDRLPIEDLLENPDQALDPSPNDLHPKVLRRRLGRHFDEEFFSIEKPTNLNNSFVYNFKGGRPSGPRPDYLKYLRTFRLADGRRVRLKMSKKQRRRLQKLVWSFTFCPVKFSWKDLGVRFWPRWLREGDCWNGKPCSIPPGMTCKPSKNVNKTILRWHCGSRRSRRRRRHCRWISVLYPIITQCSCAC
ncbi:hypothetical protein ACOMHN_061344 [Nucella lapillus]